MEVSPERYAPHLSEFYSMMNSNGNNRSGNRTGHAGNHDADLNASGSSAGSTPLNMRRPSSIRSGLSGFSITDLRALVTKEDIHKTETSVKNLVTKVSKYSQKLNELAQFSTEIAFELEDMARLKGCSDLSADKLANASGLFHLMSNHDRIISNCCEEVVVKGLNEKVERLETQFKAEELEFKKQFKEQSIKLKLQERFNSNLAKRKIRNLVSYRDNLSILQNQLDQLELLKHDFYQKSYDLVESTCQEALRDVATLARAQIEISENIARKGWSGGGLDNLIIDADDPFNAGNDEETELVTSIIPALSSPGHSRSDTLTPTRSNAKSSNSPLPNTYHEQLQSPVRLGSEASNDSYDDDSTCKINGNAGSSSSTSNNSEQDNEDGEQDSENFDNSFSLPVTSASNNKESTASQGAAFSTDNILGTADDLSVTDQSSTKS